MVNFEFWESNTFRARDKIQFKIDVNSIDKYNIHP